jgi:crotonobetainyl-CoA:carnitine CoA-transferase CaiB-like acyl-CoA transferase
VKTPLEVTQDEQALANDFFVEWDHPRHGKIKVLNNPIKLSKTPAGIKSRAPDLGEHTEEIMKGLGYSEAEVAKMKETGVIG